MNPVVRGELWSLGFGAQFTESFLAGVCDANGIIDPTLLTYLPGIFETATLPDPEPSFDPRWGFGTASYRNWYTTYLGKTSFNGSIGDMTVLNGFPLRWPIGPCATTPSNAATLTQALNGATTAGALTIVTTLDTIASNDIVCIGEGTAWAEARSVTRTAASTYTVNKPLSYAHATGTPVVKHGTTASYGVFTHVITDGMVIDPMQISVINKDSDLTTVLFRRYIGAKIGRASYSASEGTELKMSWEEILPRTMAFLDTTAYGGASVPFYLAGLTAPTVEFPTTQPYYFSQGALTYAGVSWCRVRDFNLDVSNNIDPKYYICSTAVANRVPYELREGKKDYTLRMTVDITDAAFFTDLCRMGTGTRNVGSTFSGFDVSLVFSRGASDSITFTLPGTAAAAGGNSQGCLLRRAPHNIEEAPLLSVPLDILTRNLKITIVDSIMVYP